MMRNKKISWALFFSLLVVISGIFFSKEISGNFQAKASEEQTLNISLKKGTASNNGILKVVVSDEKSDDELQLEMPSGITYNKALQNPSVADNIKQKDNDKIFLNNKNNFFGKPREIVLNTDQNSKNENLYLSTIRGKQTYNSRPVTIENRNIKQNSKSTILMSNKANNHAITNLEDKISGNKVTNRNWTSGDYSDQPEGMIQSDNGWTKMSKFEWGDVALPGSKTSLKYGFGSPKYRGKNTKPLDNNYSYSVPNVMLQNDSGEHGAFFMNGTRQTSTPVLGGYSGLIDANASGFSGFNNYEIDKGLINGHTAYWLRYTVNLRNNRVPVEVDEIEYIAANGNIHVSSFIT